MYDCDYVSYNFTKQSILESLHQNKYCVFILNRIIRTCSVIKVTPGKLFTEFIKTHFLFHQDDGYTDVYDNLL